MVQFHVAGHGQLRSSIGDPQSTRITQTGSLHAKTYMLHSAPGFPWHERGLSPPPPPPLLLFVLPNESVCPRVPWCQQPPEIGGFSRANLNSGLYLFSLLLPPPSSPPLSIFLLYCHLVDGTVSFCQQVKAIGRPNHLKKENNSFVGRQSQARKLQVNYYLILRRFSLN